ncbi:MAG: outer membrane protein assembly factor BamD [Vicinamibacterales bacterium]
MSVRVLARSVIFVAIAAMAAAVTGCAHGSSSRMPTAGERDADKYLFDRGTEALAKHRWLDAREYFKKIVDTYPGSPYRQDAKLGVGDSYLGEKRIETDILGASEFREFLRFFPLASRADYAQYQLAVSQVRQVLGPERDQTATHDALRELDLFIDRYPASKYMPDILKLRRQMKDRLSDSEVMVGRHYFRTRWYPGATARLEQVLKDDPEYIRRDAVYFFLAESYYKLNKKAEALPYYERVVQEFRVSEYLKAAARRIAELGRTEAVATTAPAAPAPAEATR